MKLVDQNSAMVSMNVTGTKFTFSGIRPDPALLSAMSYTVVTLIIDVSSSVASYKAELERMRDAVVEACKNHPQAENLIIRIVVFNSGLTEVFGFKPVGDVTAADLKDLNCHGCTALFDASFYGIGATIDYCKLLSDEDYTVNGAVYIITDGEDNSSTFTPAKIKALIADLSKQEIMDSLVTILIGVNTSSSGINSYLQSFKDDAGLTQYISIANATPNALAKLGNFISQSISSSSKALTQGKGSQPIQPSLTF